jgi:hypothetical protein
MIPYEEFQQKMEKLITHAIKRGVDLEYFHHMTNKQCGTANEIHRCGTIACLAGYAPEIWPDQFEWESDDKDNERGVRCKETGRIGVGIIWSILGVPAHSTPEYDALVDSLNGLEPITCWPFENIFERNHYNFLDYDPEDPDDPWHHDDEVCEMRLEVIKNCDSYEDLAEEIGPDTEVF